MSRFHVGVIIELPLAGPNQLMPSVLILSHFLHKFQYNILQLVTAESEISCKTQSIIPPAKHYVVLGYYITYSCETEILFRQLAVKYVFAYKLAVSLHINISQQLYLHSMQRCPYSNLDGFFAFLNVVVLIAMNNRIQIRKSNFHSNSQVPSINCRNKPYLIYPWLALFFKISSP